MELVRKIYSILAGTRKDVEVTKGKTSNVYIDLNLSIFTFFYLGHEVDLSYHSEVRSRKYVAMCICFSWAIMVSKNPGGFNGMLRSEMEKWLWQFWKEPWPNLSNRSVALWQQLVCTRKELPRREGQAHAFCWVVVGCFRWLENSQFFYFVTLKTKVNKQDKKILNRLFYLWS